MSADPGPRGRRPQARVAAVGAHASRRTRHAELLIVCARIDFNP